MLSTVPVGPLLDQTSSREQAKKVKEVSNAIGYKVQRLVRPRARTTCSKSDVKHVACLREGAPSSLVNGASLRLCNRDSTQQVK